MAFDKIPTSMVDPARHFADAPALAAATMSADEDGHLITVEGLGIYRLAYGSTDTVDGAATLAIGGGRAHRTATADVAVAQQLQAFLPQFVTATLNPGGTLRAAHPAPGTPGSQDARASNMVLDGVLYQHATGTTVGSGYRYNLTADTWSNDGPLGSASWSPCGFCAHNGRIYSVQSQSSASTNMRIAYHLPGATTPTNTSVVTFTVTVGYGFAMVSDGADKIYMVQTGSSNNTLWVFNSTSNTITKLANPPAGFQQVSSIQYHNGYVLVIASSGGAEANVFSYNISTDTWVKHGYSPERAIAQTGFKIENLWFFVGGYIQTSEVLGTGGSVPSIDNAPGVLRLRAFNLDSFDGTEDGIRFTGGTLETPYWFQSHFATYVFAGVDYSLNRFVVRAYVSDLSAVRTWTMGWTTPATATETLYVTVKSPFSTAVNYTTGQIGRAVVVEAGEKYGIIGYDTEGAFVTQKVI